MATINHSVDHDSKLGIKSLQQEQIDKSQMLISKLCQIDKGCFSPRPRVKNRLHVSVYVIMSICVLTTKRGCAKKWYTLQIARQKTYYNTEHMQTS